jgi:RNA polymerase sigma-70 factor (ECF subfamily)
MMADEHAPQGTNPQPGKDKQKWFVTTSWTNLMQARQGDTPEAREALEVLCETYWYPLYAYARRNGHNAQDAEDMTQAFFFQLLEKNFLGSVDRRKGKFRSFLLASLNHFMANRWDYETAAKRGGGRKLVSLDEKTAEERYTLEPSIHETPEKIFESQWAATLLESARTRLEQENTSSEKARLYGHLREFIVGDVGSGDYVPIAEQLDMTPGAVAVAVHRLRNRYAELVREEVVRTVGDPEEVEDELRHLLKVLGVDSI